MLDLRNIEEPFLDPEVTLVAALVHRGRSIDVDTDMVDGEIVMRDKQLTRVDKEQLYQDLKRDLDRPLRPEELKRREMGRKMEPYLREFYRGDFSGEMTPHTVYNARA